MTEESVTSSFNEETSEEMNEGKKYPSDEVEYGRSRR